MKKSRFSALGIPLLYAVVIWVSIALLSYGIALKEYSKDPGDPGLGKAVKFEAKVKSFSTFPSMSFRIENGDEKLIVRDLGDGVISELYKTHMRDGAIVSGTYVPDLGIVLDLIYSPTQRDQAQIITRPQGLAGYREFRKGLESVGSRYMLFGMLLFPVFYIVKRVLFALFRKPKTSPSEAA